MRKYILPTALLLFAFTFIGVSVLAPFQQAEAAFKKNNLITDSIFNQKHSMSASQINSFLNNFNHSCISPNSGFAAKKPVGYNPSDGWLYGSYVNAGKVINAAAKAYDLNPRVIIATLEKEQSLITGRNSSTYCNNSNHKYAAAMGNACPDGGASYSYSGTSLYRRNGNVVNSVGSTCVKTKAEAGFSQQIIRATWKLKFWQQRSMGNVNWAIVKDNWDNSDDLGLTYTGAMTRGNHKRCGSCQTIFYDGYHTIDGKSVFLSNGATASLYRYTPHFHGNELFVHFFEKWFGSTTLQWGADITQVNFYNDSGRTDSLDSITPLTSGKTIYVTIKAKNTGRGTWHDSFVRLGTVNPANRKSKFRDDSWLSHNRPTALEESAVSPGGTGTFKFSITSPTSDGFYGERFRIVADGKNQGWMRDDPKRQFNITVSNPYNGLITRVKKYRNSGMTQPTDTRALVQDQKAYIKVKAKNTGQNTWSSSVNTRIATVDPGSSSPFTADSWREHNRPAYLAEPSIAPGQTGTFIFEINAPSSSGTYIQGFQLVSDGQDSGWMPGAKVTLKSRVVEAPISNIRPGERLFPGERLKPVLGSKYKAVFQGDGNFVVYKNGKALWSSRTNGKNAKKIVMQGDGNLVIYKKGGSPLWNSRTSGKNQSVLKMQGDGNLVIYNGSGRPIWHTGTHNK